MKRLFLPLALLVGGCVSMPAALQGEFMPIQPGDAARSGVINAPVRWGGRVLKVEPQADYSCFEVVGMPLDTLGRPVPFGLIVFLCSALAAWLLWGRREPGRLGTPDQAGDTAPDPCRSMPG